MSFNFKANSKTLIVLILVHLIFFFVKVCLGDFFLQDSYDYYKLAENINNHFTFYSADLNSVINFENYTKRPPLYALFILVFSFLLKLKVTVLIAQNILSIFSILLTINIFKAYINNINIKLYVSLIIASASQFVYANYLMSELFFQFLIILLCYSFHKTIKTKSLKYVLYSQFIIIFLFLTKPVFYLFVIPNIIICICLAKRIVRKAYLFSLIPIAALLLYITWNEQRTGSYEFSSIQNLSVTNYSLKYFHTNKYGKDYALKINKQINNEADKSTSYKERQHVLKTKTLGYIKKDLFSYAWFHIKGSFRMLLDPGRFDLYNFFNFENTGEVGFLSHINSGGITGAFNYFKQQPLLILILIPVILVFNIIKAFGFTLFWIKNYKTAPPFLFYALFIIVYIVGLTGPSGAARFLVPLIPLYCIFASQGFNKKQIF